MIGFLKHIKQSVRIRTRFKNYIRQTNALPKFRILRHASIKSVSPEKIKNFRVLWPPENKIAISGSASDARFLAISKYFNDGFCSRSEIFACEVVNALCHVGTGLVCTDDYMVISDSQMEYRLEYNPEFGWLKPWRIRRLPGTCATINNIFTTYWWHWVADCLPRIFLLSRAYPAEKITMLVPDGLYQSFYDSLECLLPPTFSVLRLSANTWVKPERMIFSSYATGRANGFMPGEVRDFMRRTAFAKLGIVHRQTGKKRLFLSRARMQHCRILNESELMKLLRRYGFESVQLETIDFRRQVALFHDAEVIAGPHGSNWGNLVWAGEIKILVLYPCHPPETHTFTYSKACGQQHFFTAGNEATPYSDFIVNLELVENVLQNEMKLEPVDPVQS